MISTLQRANALSDKEFVAKFGSLYERSSWVAAGASKERPFGSVDEMHAAFERVVAAASDRRRLALIEAHPDLAGKAAIAGELTEESAGEQATAGLDRLSPEEFKAFTRINRAYREKFSMPMIVCVRRHTKWSILRQAEKRLSSTKDAEVRVALGEIAKITRLRLNDIIEEQG
ncbi:2-oxo-4-hydroxy-4-carboxy-5-ureidoimidazoline decarboxylase [Rubrobacter indicoceani]|uniref:2-oxo-4-hydroxy-4-carboxy-5-ureidoimidazoline decarboxylase n=1 Tax=Rubrobacter indicoceani TaxID=2051957 RepID=UPI000E5BA69E|nr:2-oxo-4-hydroxy-4-carboxy-5-ureidoimidazoline decarboxylase [Rubrobacter indicoceani]